MIFAFRIDRDDQEEPIVVNVEGEYEPAERGGRGEYGVPYEPDHPACFIVEKVTHLSTGEDFEPTEAELEEMAEEGLRVVEGSRDAAPADYWDD